MGSLTEEVKSHGSLRLVADEVLEPARSNVMTVVYVGYGPPGSFRLVAEEVHKPPRKTASPARSRTGGRGRSRASYRRELSAAPILERPHAGAPSFQVRLQPSPVAGRPCTRPKTALFGDRRVPPDAWPVWPSIRCTATGTGSYRPEAGCSPFQQLRLQEAVR